METWTGDPMLKRMGRGCKIFLDDLNGWFYVRDHPVPVDRPVWVITEYQRRCIAEGYVIGRWSLVDEKCYFWHGKEVTDMQEPPDFPVGFRIEG